MYVKKPIGLASLWSALLFTMNNAVVNARREMQNLVGILTARHHQHTAAPNHADSAVSAISWM